MKHSFMMVVTRFQGKIHVVHDPVAISHGFDLSVLHAWVERSMMGCPACPELNLQLSPLIDFAAGNSYYDPDDHIGRSELLTTRNYRGMLFISMFFNVTVLAAIEDGERLLKVSTRSLA